MTGSRFFALVQALVTIEDLVLDTMRGDTFEGNLLVDLFGKFAGSDVIVAESADTVDTIAVDTVAVAASKSDCADCHTLSPRRSEYSN